MYKYLLLYYYNKCGVFFNGDGSSLLEKEEIVDISIYQYTNNYTKSIMNYYYHYHIITEHRVGKRRWTRKCLWCQRSTE